MLIRPSFNSLVPCQSIGLTRFSLLARELWSEHWPDSWFLVCSLFKVTHPVNRGLNFPMFLHRGIRCLDFIPDERREEGGSELITHLILNRFTGDNQVKQLIRNQLTRYNSLPTSRGRMLLQSGLWVVQCLVHSNTGKLAASVVVSRGLSDDNDGGCPIAVDNGFLVRSCQESWDGFFMQCLNSSTMYNKTFKFDIATRSIKPYVTTLCPNDSIQYQACGSYSFIPFLNPDKKLFQTSPVCGKLCYEHGKDMYGFHTSSQTCPGAHDDSADRVGKTFSTVEGDIFTILVKKGGFCDGRCDRVELEGNIAAPTLTCFDERSCNGYNYGAVSKSKKEDGNYLFSPFNDLLEKIITESSITSDFPLYNASRCFIPLTRSANHLFTTAIYGGVSYCYDGLDQTNCSDPAKIAGSCLIGGYLSTVSIYVVCSEKSILCDDEVHKNCPTINRYCTIHKHQLCNGQDDCAMGADERKATCLRLTQRSCVRGFSPNQGALRIPVDWVQDGEVDCLNGEDEKTNWQTCGKGIRRTIKYSTKKCTNVFLCKHNMGKFVEATLLCSFSSNCDEEVCRMAKRRPQISRKMLSTSLSAGIKLKSSVCTKGLQSILFLTDQICQSKTFNHPFHLFFGKNFTTKLVFPTTERDCRYLYGEAYVFYSCLGLCYNTPCPLKRPVLHSTCSNLRNTFYSLNFELGAITTVQKSRERFHNNFFVCKNTNCILFEKVCDLVDDCGDGSDEEECTNNFQCSDKSGFLALSQKCDRKIDCKDFSDECNESCRRKAVSTDAILGVALVMGITGFVFGVGGLIRNIKQKSEKSGELVNQAMVLMISVGDLLTSVYLLTLTTVHWIHGSRFCEYQIEWISGAPCTIIGILNCVGSSISSIVMALVSCFRLHGTVKALRYRRSKKATLKLKIKLGVLLAVVILVSLAVSTFPLLDSFNEWFVNGLVFERDLTLFLGVMDKSQLLKIVRGYHGSHETRRSKSGNAVSWNTYQEMISEMFSQDYYLVRGKRLSFYGNDPVCIFKAFVHSDDPQVLFVWAYLSFHFLCFLCVAICHGLIAILVRRSHIQSTRTSDNSLNCNVSLICLTDFCCWMPFLICCVLHTAEVVDMSPWYQIFSLNILPLNSYTESRFVQWCRNNNLEPLQKCPKSGLLGQCSDHSYLALQETRMGQANVLASPDIPDIPPEDAPEDFPELPLDVPSAEYAADTPEDNPEDASEDRRKNSRRTGVQFSATVFPLTLTPSESDSYFLSLSVSDN
eukprot:sb/3461176/